MDSVETIRKQLKIVQKRKLTLPEAAVVFDTDVTLIRRAVDRGNLEASVVQRGARRHRLLAADHVLVWTMAKPLRSDYHTAFKKLLFEPKSWLVENDRVFLSLPSEDNVVVAKYQIYLNDIVGTISGRLEALDEAHSHIEIRKAGDPLIKGTQIEVHRIAALVDGGASVKDVLRDFPTLTSEQVAAAVAYSKAHPKNGRPYPSQSAKSAMLAGRGGLRRAFAAADEE